MDINSSPGAASVGALRPSRVGPRLEKKLTALRAGQLAFASAVTDLNTAAGRAEAALASLRASGQETDLLHDRILKAREVKAQLEALIARGGANLSPPRSGEGGPASAGPRDAMNTQRIAAVPVVAIAAIMAMTTAGLVV